MSYLKSAWNLTKSSRTGGSSDLSWLATALVSAAWRASSDDEVMFYGDSIGVIKF